MPDPLVYSLIDVSDFFGITKLSYFTGLAGTILLPLGLLVVASDKDGMMGAGGAIVIFLCAQLDIFLFVSNESSIVNIQSGNTLKTPSIAIKSRSG